MLIIQKDTYEGKWQIHGSPLPSQSAGPKSTAILPTPQFCYPGFHLSVGTQALKADDPLYDKSAERRSIVA